MQCGSSPTTSVAASTVATAARNAARKFADAAVLNVVRVTRVTYAKH